MRNQDSSTTLINQNGALLLNGAQFVVAGNSTLVNFNKATLINEGGFVETSGLLTPSKLLNQGNAVLLNVDIGTKLINRGGAALINGPTGMLVNQGGATLVNSDGVVYGSSFRPSTLANQAGATIINSDSGTAASLLRRRLARLNDCRHQRNLGRRCGGPRSRHPSAPR